MAGTASERSTSREGTRQEGTRILVSTPDEDARLRALIRAELERQHAMPVARRTLELLAEAAAEPTGSAAGYRIVDRHGETRLRPPAEDPPKKKGKADKPPAAPLVPFTLADLVGELRERHPDLFATPPEPEPAPPPPAKEPSHAVQDTVASVKAASARFVATQSVLARSFAALSARRGRALTAAASGTVEGWRSRLDGHLDTRRDPPPADLPAAQTHGTTRAGTSLEATGRAGATQSRRDWRSAARGAVLRVRTGRRHLAAGLRDRFARGAGPAAAVSPDEGGHAERRRRIAIGLGGVAALALVAAVATVGRDPTSRTAPGPAPQASPPSASTQRDAPGTAPGSSTKPAPLPGASPGAQQADPELQPSSEDPPPNASDLAGVPEVVDTATLRLAGKVVRLFGVEWVRGGQPEDLTRYLAGRRVTCQPAPGSSAYLCGVDGRDLSEVVLFNGGGRASAEATPDLAAAEDHARSERLGVWKR